MVQGVKPSLGMPTYIPCGMSFLTLYDQLPIQLPAHNAPGQVADDGSVVWIPASQPRGPECSASRLQLGLLSFCKYLWKEPVDKGTLPSHLYPSLFISHSLLNKLIKCIDRLFLTNYTEAITKKWCHIFKQRKPKNLSHIQTRFFQLEKDGYPPSFSFILT